MNSKVVVFRNIFLVIGLAALVAMVYAIGWEEIITNIRKTGWWFFGIIGVWLVVYLLNATAWGVIIKDEDNGNKVSKLTILKLTISGYAINYSTPMGLAGGEPYRVMELSRFVGGKKATSSVLLYAMMHFVSHFFLWILSIFLLAWVAPLSLAQSILLTVVFVVCAGLIYLFFRGYRKGMLVKLSKWCMHLPFGKKRIHAFVEKHRDNIQEIDLQISDLYLNRKKTFVLSLSLEFLARIVSCFEVFFIFHSIGQTIWYVDSIVLVALSSLFANILCFTPMQLGTREGGFALALSALKMSAGLGIYVSLITRIREVFWIMIGLLLVKFSPKKHD